MKIIKLSANNKLSVHEYPTGDYSQQNQELRGLIGDDCHIYEHVKPRKLYTLLGHEDTPTKIKGECVSMLIDEEGLIKDRPVPINYVASFLYDGATFIAGNVLFVGEEWCDDGIDFCGINDVVFERLYAQLDRTVGILKGVQV
jgi:hypothetical protein